MKKSKIIFGFILMMLLLLTSVSVFGALTDGLTQYWSFDTNARNQKMGINLTVNGATQTNTTCKLGGCYSYDGGDWLNGNVAWSSANSVSYWVRPTSLSTSTWVVAGGYGTGYPDSFIGTSGQVYGRSSSVGSGVTSANGLSTVNNWVHVVFVSNGTITRLYVNGTNRGNTTETSTVGTGLTIGRRPTPGNYLTGKIDDVGMWNRALTASEVTQLFNGGVGLNPLATTTPNINITFISQNPNDLSFLNIIHGVNITYSFLNENTSRQRYLNYTVNDMSCPIRENGTCVTYPLKELSFSEVGENLKYVLDEYDIVPGTYNIKESYSRNAVKTKYLLDNNNERMKIRFTGLKVNSTYNALEINLISSVDQMLPIFYCNATYTMGSVSISTLPNGCTVLGQIETTGAYNHTHTSVSGHQTIPFYLNPTTKKLNNGSVTATSTAYFIIPGVSGNSMNVSYVTNNTLSLATSINSGTTYSTLIGTVDAHVHQFFGHENLSYYACGFNLTGSQVCSATVNDEYDALPSFEELPFVDFTNPLDGQVFASDDPLTIRWSGFDFDGDVLTYELIVDGNIIYTNTTNTSYVIDLSAYLGDITTTIKACEQSAPTRCSDVKSLTFSVVTASAVGIDFNWNMTSTPVPFGCPTNPMQFLILMFFFMIDVTMMVLGFVLKSGITYITGGSLLIVLTTFFWGCDPVLGVSFTVIAIASIIFGLTVKTK